MFRTYEPARDRLAAVKVFRLDITPEQAQTLAGELGRAADAGLFHPSIVEPIAAGVQGTVAYRAEEYMPAESLDVAMRHHAPSSPDRVLPIVTQLAGAIDFARASGVGHGALHPRDVFVTPEEARVTGFGVVEALERVGLRAPVRRPYSPPERIAGEPWGTPADVFSLAAITFELLTGRRPAGTGPGIGEIKDESAGPHAARLLAVLARAMSDRPDDRYPGALAFASALEAASRGQGEAAVVPVPAAGMVQHDQQRPPEWEAPVGALTSDRGMPAAPEPAFAEEEPSTPAVEAAGSADEVQLPDRGTEPDRPTEPRTRKSRVRPSRPESPAREAEPLVAGAAASSVPEPVDTGARSLEPRGRHLEEARGPSPEASSPADITAERDEDEAHWNLTRREEDAERFMLDAADLALDDAAGAAAFASEAEVEAPVPGEAAARGSAKPHARDPDETTASAAAPAGGRGVPLVVPPAHAAAQPPAPARTVGDSFTYDRPLAEELTADSRVFVVPHSRAAMLPLAIALIIGLPLAFAAGYVVRGRTEAVPPPAPVEQAAAADPGSPTAGTTYSESAIDPAPEPVPPAAPPDVPSDPAGPEPVPGPATGRLVVRSTPAGAHVTVNGRWSGRTPLTLTDLEFGDYAVRVVADGYRIGREAFTLDSSNATRTIAMRLEREPAAREAAPAAKPPAPPAGSSSPTVYYGRLFVDSRPQGATVYVGGEARGKTPLRLPQVPIGSHVVRLELVDHRAWTKVVRVTAGQEARATGSLDPIR